MLRFRLGQIPVEVHLTHVAISALLAFMFAEPTGSDVWPNPGLRAHDNATMVAVVGLWMVIISFSVLFHEMGHALASRAFGYSPSIHLVGFGGLTQPNANETIPWHRDIILTLAGPFAGLSLGLGAGALEKGLALAGSGSPAVLYALNGAFIANLFWAVLNLVPVAPLDGGRVATVGLQRLFGRRGFFFAQVLALIIGAAVITFAVVNRQVFIGIFFGMYLWRAVQNITGYNKGELPASQEPRHPFELGFAKARAMYEEGKYAEARALGDQLAALPLQPALRNQVHSLLGWLALKEGQGRDALDHFSLVHDIPVPPHALAAAFSLIGDDHRALPLWEMAARASQNPTILHEYAGTLIRVGRESDARRLHGVDMPAAFIAAERVLFLRKDFAAAAKNAEAAFTEQPSIERAYDAACDWAQASQPESALRLLKEAQKLGFHDKAKVEGDADLAPLRTLPDYAAFVASL